MTVKMILVRTGMRIGSDAACSDGGYSCRPPVEWASR